jgi:hypothetical protein
VLGVSDQDAELSSRLKIQYHLSHLFPSERVHQVMAANPNVNDVHDLCKLLIDMQCKS